MNGIFKKDGHGHDIATICENTEDGVGDFKIRYVMIRYLIMNMKYDNISLRRVMKCYLRQEQQDWW